MYPFRKAILVRKFCVCPSCLQTGSSPEELLQSGLLFFSCLWWKPWLCVMACDFWLCMSSPWPVSMSLLVWFAGSIYCTTELDLSCKIFTWLLLQDFLYSSWCFHSFFPPHFFTYFSPLSAAHIVPVHFLLSPPLHPGLIRPECQAVFTECPFVDYSLRNHVAQ